MVTTSDRQLERRWPVLTSRTILVLACLGTAHLVVDATCGWLVARLVNVPGLGHDFAWQLAIAYNILAFAGQPFLGLVVDRYRSGRLAAAVGCLATACAVPALAVFPVAGVVLAGIGNAVFHVGGGGISLRLTPGRAAAPGLFVAPGAIGLALGTMAGRGGAVPGWIFLLLATMAGVAAFLVAPAAQAQPASKPERPAQMSRVELVLSLLCFAIAVRSATCLAMTSLWKSAPTIMVLLALAAAAGKAAAGILADRYGWLQVTVPALLVAAPLASFGAHAACLVVPGMLLVQVAMPVTVAAMGRLFPDKPSFAFGLASLALVVGAVPIFFGAGTIISRSWVSCVLQLASVAALLAGLRSLQQTLQTQPLADAGRS